MFGTIDPREDDISVELPIGTLSRILKVTQFHKHVQIICEAGHPVCLRAQLGIHNSHVDVFIHQHPNGGGAATDAAPASSSVVKAPPPRLPHPPSSVPESAAMD